MHIKVDFRILDGNGAEQGITETILTQDSGFYKIVEFYDRYGIKLRHTHTQSTMFCSLEYFSYTTSFVFFQNHPFQAFLVAKTYICIYEEGQIFLIFKA